MNVIFCVYVGGGGGGGGKVGYLEIDNFCILTTAESRAKIGT